MVAPEWDAVVEIIHRIRKIEGAYRGKNEIDHALVAMFCKWAAQDVLEESEWSEGYIG